MFRKIRKYKTWLGVLSIILICSCISEITNDESEEQHITLNFLGTAPMNVKQPEFTISIFGYDPLLEDHPASLIVKEAFEATEVPFTLRIPIPENPSSKIDGLRNEEDARYYLNLEWDSDGNGIICEGDIGIDYNAKIPNLDLESQEEQNIYLSYIPESTFCE